MDAITSVIFDVAASQTGGSGHATPNSTTIFDVAQFEKVYNKQPSGSVPEAVHSVSSVENQGLAAAIESLKLLNGSMEGLGIDALKAAADGHALTPSEMLQITVKSHEFVFQSQLTATVANKTSDGIAQLFRQQS